jgi:hypothetical protein
VGDCGSTVVKVLRYSGGPRERRREGTAIRGKTAVALGGRRGIKKEYERSRCDWRSDGGSGDVLQWGTAVAQWLRFCATVGDRGSTVVKVLCYSGEPR